MRDSLPYLLVVLGILLFLVLPTWRQVQRQERRALRMQREAREQGLHEPISLHPSVDPARCFASGACILACPEHSVLEVIGGHAQLVRGADCIGHGACRAACPGGAIRLVFGSEARGVEIPQVGPDFQTNVPGLYIAGELGGMGLIAGAARQGVEAAEHMLDALPPKPPGGVDVAIVGAGPAGLAAGLLVHGRGASYALIEQEEFGGAIRHYPRQKIVMTRPMVLPGFREVRLYRARKEELIAILEEAVASTGLRIDQMERVEAVLRRDDGTFLVRTSRRELLASRVLLAVGRRGTPRRLDVPGEEREKVAYRLLDPERYQHSHLLVVGGGDSAVEAACALAEQPGTRVTLSYRGDSFTRARAANRERLAATQATGRLEIVTRSEVVRVDEDRVVLVRGDERIVLANDYVFVLIGGVLPSEFLRAAGIELATHFGTRVEHRVAPAGPERHG